MRERIFGSGANLVPNPGGWNRQAAQALHLSQLVRHLAVCLGNSVHLSKLDNTSLTRMRELLAWCSEYAHEIDPTCQPEVLLRSFYGKETGFLDP